MDLMQVRLLLVILVIILELSITNSYLYAINMQFNRNSARTELCDSCELTFRIGLKTLSQTCFSHCSRACREDHSVAPCWL